MTRSAEVMVRLRGLRMAPTRRIWAFCHVLCWNRVEKGRSKGIMASGGVNMVGPFVVVWSG